MEKLHFKDKSVLFLNKTNCITLRRRGGGNYQQGGQSTREKTRPFRENSDAT